MSKYVYGIDLGTTYSCIAYQDENGQPVVAKNHEGHNTTPSVVQFQDGNVVVGEAAKDTAELSPDDTIMFVKQLMGVTANAYTGSDGHVYSPSEISAEILKKLAQDAGEFVDDTVTDVVITCPAYFGENERTATKQAGAIAGLNVLAIIEEPTAAAIYYGCTRAQDDQTVLIYDLGGGTFDITVMQITKGEIRVVCTDGDHNLGGKNWDEALSRYLMDQFVEKTGFDGEFDSESLQDLAIMSETVKQQLGVPGRTSVKKKWTVDGVSAVLEVTAAQFEELTVGPLMDTTIKLTRDALANAREKGVENIDELLLVGGSTKMPQVRRRLEEEFGLTCKSLEPDEAVAKGAAIFACMEAFKPAEPAAPGEEPAAPAEKPRMSLPPAGGSVRIVSASTKSFGIKVYNKDDREVIQNLILKDNELPIEVSELFGTHMANQESALLEIYESTIKEKEYDPDPAFLKGEASLTLPPNTPKDAPIKVTMRLGTDGTLHVTGRNENTGEECHGDFISDCVLNSEALAEAIAHSKGLRRVES